MRHRQGVRAPRAAAAVHFPTDGPASGVATRLACKLRVGARASAWFRRWNRNLRLLRDRGAPNSARCAPTAAVRATTPFKCASSHRVDTRPCAGRACAAAPGGVPGPL